MNNKLYPNCSEYVTRIKLTPAELVKAKEWAKNFGLNEECLKWLYEHLAKGTDEIGLIFGSFIEEELAVPYTEIKEKILEERENYNIEKRRWWDRDRK